MKNDKNIDFESIYVHLLDEGLNVLRPVLARKIRENCYEILDDQTQSKIENWEFKPGALVECEEKIDSSGSKIKVAIRKK